jgi:hypothetical protein
MPLPDYSAIREVSRLVDDGVAAALADFRAGKAPDEPRLVERMLVKIEHAVSGAQINGLRWEAGTLSSSGRAAAEPRYGADFLGVFEVDLPDFRIAKGFLAQAKLIRNGSSLGAAERKRLRRQCTKMLACSPDSFVFVLQPNAVTIVPAISVVAGDIEPMRLYHRGVEAFFEEHFACFVGDGIFSGGPNASALDDLTALQDRYDTRHVLYISASIDPGRTRDRLRAMRK